MDYRWEWTTCNIGTGTVAKVYNQIATDPVYGLPALGYTGIEVGSDVHGWKGKVIVVALLLPISGSDYWLIVSCAGDTADAQSNANGLMSQIKIILNDYF
jgi:hypothetical protein